MTETRILVGDCIEVMRAGTAESIDAIVTDPPYGLGFMGKEWDALPPGKEWAEECFRVLKPGGHLLAFGGTRTYHRLTVAIEDAGFEIRDCLAWLYGQGFPKSQNVSKMIDKAAGVTRPEVAEQWDGWGTALKPAFEPIVLARKPFKGTVVKNVLEHGTGAINVDGCRIAGDTSQDGTGGRWPANVLLDEEAAALLDEQTTEKLHLAGNKGGTPRDLRNYSAGERGKTNDVDEMPASPDDSHTGASRFFYCAKASKRERNAGLDHLPDSDVTDSTTFNPTKPVCNVCGCGTLVPGPGKTLSCGHTDYRFEPSEHTKTGERKSAVKNGHPTVKPIEVMRWLVRLITPPGGRVLDPFMGSGTTGIACVLEGFNFVGIELDPEYAEIASARVAHWKEEEAFVEQ